MARKHIVYDTRNWRTGDFVILNNITLRIVAAHHDERCSTFSLVDPHGATYRYAAPLKLHRTN
jgi:hypothetical protein